ncbi:hypothetical protein L1987_29933 [Smallanthus sonchifolius]|uniref:Uncharacterized protein n=1 Tax=Smallanthus sonchifolius TaxID=185202 RepID=A0ACB9I235_9ASTR|nr:hypothetical protein L1987_29933 [Smallanthus sonchifolius]
MIRISLGLWTDRAGLIDAAPWVTGWGDLSYLQFCNLNSFRTRWPLAMQYAVSSMDEVDKMCRLGEPLWTQVNDFAKEVLNLDEYVKMFPCRISRNSDSNLRYEASRASSVVIINSLTLVDAFLNVVTCPCYNYLFLVWRIDVFLFLMLF